MYLGGKAGLIHTHRGIVEHVKKEISDPTMDCFYA